MGKKKALEIGVEEFYGICALVFGAPNKNAAYNYIYSGNPTFEKGVGAYLKHTVEGQKFTQCVTQCGEAKSRAPYWFMRYVKWYDKQERRKHVQQTTLHSGGESAGTDSSSVRSEESADEAMVRRIRSEICRVLDCTYKDVQRRQS